jgi:hypothetical protein
MATGPDEFNQYKLRLPDSLRDSLNKSAEAADRSLNSEIVWRLTQSLAPEWPAFIASIEQREQSERLLLEALRQSPEAMSHVQEVMRQMRDNLVKENRQLGKELREQGHDVGKLISDAPPKKMRR